MSPSSQRSSLRFRFRLQLALSLACGASALYPTPAFADASASDVKAARAKFQEGVRDYDKGQYEKARAAFLQTYALHKHPAVLLNLAQSCLKAGHALEADSYFRQFIREATMTPKEKSAAESGLAEARQRLGRLDIHATAGASITIDGADLGSAPLAEPVDVEPGAHIVHSGTEEQRPTVTAGQTLAVQFGLAPATPATTAAAPAADSSTKKKYLAPPKNMIPVYVAGGVGVVGIVTGIILLGEKGAATNQANAAAALIQAHGGGSSTCAQTDAADVAKFGNACSALSTDNSNIKTDGTIGDIALVVGIASLIGGGVYYLLADKADDAATSAPAAPPASTAKLSPSVGRGFQGLSLVGTF